MLRSIVLAAAIIVGLATSATSQNSDILGQWLCTKECGPGLGSPILISERSDGTMIFYASPIPPGRYRDIAEGRWIGTDTVALKGILGSGFNKVKWARVSPGGLVFEDGAEWQKVPDRPAQNRP